MASRTVSEYSTGSGNIIIVVRNICKHRRTDGFRSWNALWEKFNQWTQQLAEKGGLMGALLLGFLFALSFCPVSAALFFGSLIPLALKHHSGLMLPLIYGTGTALPVLVFGFLLAFGGNKLGRVFDRIARFELWSRRLTGVLFIGIGIYFLLYYTFELFI